METALVGPQILTGTGNASSLDPFTHCAAGKRSIGREKRNQQMMKGGIEEGAQHKRHPHHLWMRRERLVEMPRNVVLGSNSDSVRFARL